MLCMAAAMNERAVMRAAEWCLRENMHAECSARLRWQPHMQLRFGIGHPRQAVMTQQQLLSHAQ